jgi:chemotaxis protein methyltransferase CheR
MAMAVAGADRQRAAPFLTERFLILGTDLAPHAVAAARAATYAPAQLRNIPPPLAKAWTRGRTDGFTIAPELAGRCRFNHINLLGEWPMRQQFAAIFCRNVMIYFDEETQSTLLQRLVNALEPGGLLCIGHSERIIGPATSQLRSIGHTMFENIG